MTRFESRSRPAQPGSVEVMRLLREDEAAGMLLSSPALGEYAPASLEAAPHFEPGALVAGRFRIARFIASG